MIWLAILVLATMRSPFMATYAFFPVMWLAALVAPIGGSGPRAIWPIALCWCALALGFGPEHPAEVECGLDHDPDSAHLRPAGIRAPAATRPAGRTLPCSALTEALPA